MFFGLRRGVDPVHMGYNYIMSDRHYSAAYLTECTYSVHVSQGELHVPDTFSRSRP